MNDISVLFKYRNEKLVLYLHELLQFIWNKKIVANDTKVQYYI